MHRAPTAPPRWSVSRRPSGRPTSPLPPNHPGSQPAPRLRAALPEPESPPTHHTLPTPSPNCLSQNATVDPLTRPKSIITLPTYQSGTHPFPAATACPRRGCRGIGCALRFQKSPHPHRLDRNARFLRLLCTTNPTAPGPPLQHRPTARTSSSNYP